MVTIKMVEIGQSVDQKKRRYFMLQKLPSKSQTLNQLNVIILSTSLELQNYHHDGSARLLRGGNTQLSSLIKSIYQNDLFKVSSPHPAALLKALSCYHP